MHTQNVNSSHVIKIKNLSYNFGRYWALKNISFELPRGKFLFLTGRSGAGKTTFLRLLHGALPLKRGQAEVAGFDLNQLKSNSLHKLRREVSVVFQDFKVLKQRSVFQNVALALEVKGMNKTQIQRRVRAVLRSLGLEDKSSAACQELSGGEQQRVAIARAVVVNPQLLLADEPTGNLDEELSWRLLQVFKQFNIHGTTIVFATHSKEILADNPEAAILELENGKIVESKGIPNLN
jgi:cell division transport system ATP-binding protein